MVLYVKCHAPKEDMSSSSVSLIVKAQGPLRCDLHEGVVMSNNDLKCL